jgi:bla regulator protein BlaR1
MNPRFFDLLSTQIWQIAALAIFVALIVRLVAKNRPHLAHAMWMLVLIKCVTPPLWGHSLGVFSQLQATFAHDDSAVSPVEPETNLTPTDASVIELSTPPMELAAADDRLLEFDEQEDLVFDSEAGSPLEVVTFDDNDAVESDETLSAIAAASIDSSKPAADDIDYRSMLMFLLLTGAITTLFVMIFRCLRCLRLIHRHRTTEFDESLNFRIQQLSKQLRIRRPPQVIVSNVLFGPAVLGLLRHTIVLPRNSSTQFSPTNSFTFAEATCEPARCKPSCKVCGGFIRRCGSATAGCREKPNAVATNKSSRNSAARPAHYARSLLSVIECKHRLQPIPVFPGMKPVEITSQRMERIMSLKNGSKKRTPTLVLADDRGTGVCRAARCGGPAQAG